METNACLPMIDDGYILYLNLVFSGILNSIKKENDEKSDEGTDITMSFPSGHDSDGLHYRVQGTFTRYVLMPSHGQYCCLRATKYESLVIISYWVK